MPLQVIISRNNTAAVFNFYFKSKQYNIVELLKDPLLFPPPLAQGPNKIIKPKRKHRGITWAVLNRPVCNRDSTLLAFAPIFAVVVSC